MTSPATPAPTAPAPALAPMPTPAILRSPYVLGVADSPIRVYTGDVTLIEAGLSVSGPGSFAIRWLPTPRLVFRTQAFGVLGYDPLDVSATRSGSAKGYMTHATFSSSAGGGTEGFIDGPIARGTGEDLATVLFHIPNFPVFSGEPVSTRSGRILHSRVNLAAGDWDIVIDGREDDVRIREALRQSGGYAVTHLGRLVRRDAAAFRVDEALDMLEALSELLSFACGTRCVPMLPIGRNARGNEVWRQWRQPYVSPYRSRLTWFRETDPEALARAFPGLYRRWTDRPQREVLRRVIYLHGQANRGGVEPGLILAQAALELLAWQVLVIETKAISGPGFEILPAADKLRLLLTACRIPLDIPGSLEDLVAAAKARSLRDAPEAMTNLRNRWVHPPRKGSLTSERAAADAWRLALWYVDLVTLWWIGYAGDYAPRVRPGTVETTPWT